MRANSGQAYSPESDQVSPTLTHRLRNIEENLDGAHEAAMSVLSKINGGNPSDGLSKTAPRACGLSSDIEVIADKTYALDALLRDINARL